MSAAGFANVQCPRLHVCKSGSIDDAWQNFDRWEQCNVVTWNVIVCAFAKGGCGVEAYPLFLIMQQNGFKPNASTYIHEHPESILCKCREEHDVVTWSVMISGVAQHGCGQAQTFGNLITMTAEGGKPSVTFVAVLSDVLDKGR